MSRSVILNRLREANKTLPQHDAIAPKDNEQAITPDGSENNNLLELLKSKLQASGVRVATIKGIDDCADELAQMIDDIWGRKPCRVRIAPDARLTNLDWRGMKNRTVAVGTWQTGDDITVSHAEHAIAASGGLVVASHKGSPTGLAFLPDVHIVVLRRDQICADLSTAFDRWPSQFQPDGTMPRAVTIVTGASRTADIGGTLVQGAHGPRHLGVLIYEEA